MSGTQKTLGFVRAVWSDFVSKSGLEPTLLHKLAVTSAKPGLVELELPLHQRHTNRLGILHGGTIASIVDLGGSLAIASNGLFATGVSTDLNVTYLSSGGKPGDTLYIETKCDKMGRTMAFTTTNFYNNAERTRLVARGSHTKFISQAWKDPRNIIETGGSKN